MSFDFKNLNNIISGNDYYYNIPVYQRPYSWNKEQVDTLLSDLLEGFSDNEENHYFCGSIVLVKENNDLRYDIIDGQQRLTTFIILLAVLQKMFEEKLTTANKQQIKDSIYGLYDNGERIRLTPNGQYVDFDQTLKNLDLDKKTSKNKYEENAKVIKDFINDPETEFNKIDINAFVKYLFNKIDFVVISVEKLDNAMKIFNVLNDRGLALKPSDILKSQMMAKLKNEEERNGFNEVWNEIFKKLDEDNTLLDRVFNYYTFYMITENPHQRYDKILIDKFQDSDIIKEVSNIKDFSNTYKEIIDAYNSRIYLLRYFRWNYCLPMAVIAKYVNYPKFNELLDILVAYYFQNLIAGNTLTRIKQTSFALMKAIKEHKSLENIKAICKNNLDKYHTTDTFKQNLEGIVDNAKWIKPLFLMLEYDRWENGEHPFIEINNKLHLEHILPQTIVEKDGTKTVWCKGFETKEKHQQFLHRLGNLTILSLKKNEEIKNFAFDIKKQSYYNKGNKISNIVLNHELADYDTWIDKDIIDRENKLKERILKKLNIF